MAFAPYSIWRRAMQYTEKNGYSPEIKTLIKEKATISPNSRATVGKMLGNKDDQWVAALLTDSHILANSKGQYLQTLNSEKVEPGAPATGIRFAFDGLYNHQGVLQPDILPPGSAEWKLLAYAATSLAMQDPWSTIATDKVMDIESPPSTATGTKRKKPTVSKESDSKKTRTDEKLLNQWELLPPSESKWMRGLLEIPGESHLTMLPCIKNKKIMPSEVTNILQSGRGKILFYANVVHVTLCPRFLVNGDAIHKHHNDSAVAICIAEKNMFDEGTPVHRLFVRCFSEKCLHHCRKAGLKQIPSMWEEYHERHYTRFARLSRHRDAVSPKAT